MSGFDEEDGSGRDTPDARGPDAGPDPRRVERAHEEQEVTVPEWPLGSEPAGSPRASQETDAAPDEEAEEETLLMRASPEPGAPRNAEAAAGVLPGGRRVPTPSPGPALFEEAPTVVVPADEPSGSPADPLSAPDPADAPTVALRPLWLERIEPSLGRGERIRLDGDTRRVRIGRAEHNEIRLYTASASRDHAVIAGNARGEWVLMPVEGKSFSVDRDPCEEPVELEAGMNLVFGGDQLRCVSEARVASSPGASAEAGGRSGRKSRRAPTRGPRSGRTGWILIAAIATLGLGLIAYAWMSG